MLKIVYCNGLAWKTGWGRPFASCGKCYTVYRARMHPGYIIGGSARHRPHDFNRLPDALLFAEQFHQVQFQQLKRRCGVFRTAQD